MIDVRTAVILLVSVKFGAVAAALQLATGGSWVDALLTAGAAVETAIGVLMAARKAIDSPDDTPEQE